MKCLCYSIAAGPWLFCFFGSQCPVICMMSTRQVREAVRGTIIHKSRMRGLSGKDRPGTLKAGSIDLLID